MARSLFHTLFKWPLQWLVRSSVIPEHPAELLQQTEQDRIIYILDHDSRVDRELLYRACSKHDLPQPEPLAGTSGIVPVNSKKKHHSLHTIFSQALAEQRKLAGDIKLVPVTMFWGRAPGRREKGWLRWLADQPAPGWLRKLLTVLWFGRDNFIRFAEPVSLRTITDQYGDDPQGVQKLIRVARFHFYRQRLSATGPRLPVRKTIFRQLLSSDVIQQAIAEEAQSKQLTQERAEARAHEYLDEIAANYSAGFIVLLDRVMTWLWSKLYRGLNVSHAESIRKLANSGHEIVYVPCHRSHMDYLLLSYVLYYQGLVPPHIAAGINLNFWPAGPIFRRGGAFFMRRSFKGNKLYSVIFREYLCWLFEQGYPVEYFTEGGRSRTGRLLNPKTGMLAMTVQSVLKGVDRPIAFVPIYLGYEHVMEVNTYLKELRGKQKTKESWLSLFGIIFKLRNYGEGFVNFGDPILLNDFLSQQDPEWRSAIGSEEKPQWLTPAVNQLARQVMTGINDAAAINGLTLGAMILLNADNKAMSKPLLATMMDSCLQLSRGAPYTERVTVPDTDGATLLDKTIELDKFTVEDDGHGPIVSLNEENAILMTYYRNNILHLFAIPSLIACCIERHVRLERSQLHEQINAIYPLLKSELFMPFDEQRLATYIDQLLDQMVNMGLLIEQETRLQIPPHATEQRVQLMSLATLLEATLLRYGITLSLLYRKQLFARDKLEQQSRSLAGRLAILHRVDSPEFYDKQVFVNQITTLKNEGAMEQTEAGRARLQTMHNTVVGLLASDTEQTIERSLNHKEEVASGEH